MTSWQLFSLSGNYKHKSRTLGRKLFSTFSTASAILVWFRLARLVISLFFPNQFSGLNSGRSPGNAASGSIFSGSATEIPDS